MGYFSHFLGLEGILVIFRFLGYFGNFLGFRDILDILEVLGEGEGILLF